MNIKIFSLWLYWGTSKAHSSDRDRLQGQVWSPCFGFLKSLILFRCKKKKTKNGVSYILSVFLLSHFAFPEGFDLKVKSSFTLFKRQEKGSKTYMCCLEGLWSWNKTTSNHIWCSYPSSSLIVTVALKKENYLHTEVLTWMNRGLRLWRDHVISETEVSQGGISFMIKLLM